MVAWLTTDPLNNNKERNIKNTARDTYNCGGYALGTYSWYCPREKEKDIIFDFNSIEEAYEKTMYAVATMVREFEGKIRMIQKLDDLNEETERVIAFRISSDGDFHYVKKTKCGWKHKRGACPRIFRMTTKQVFRTEWCDRYDGPIVLLAIKKD